VNLQELKDTTAIIDTNNGHIQTTNRVSPLTVSDMNTTVTIDTDLLDMEKQTENLAMRQFKAMVKMWATINLRSKANLVLSLVFPVIFVVVGLVVNKTATNTTNDNAPTALSLRGLAAYAVPNLLLGNSDG
jgi:hypothetical protein